MRMIEKAARAAFDENWGDHPGANSEWKRVGSEWVKWQRAAIEELMEPSEEMVETRADNYPWIGSPEAQIETINRYYAANRKRIITDWKANLRAILDEQEPKE